MEQEQRDTAAYQIGEEGARERLVTSQRLVQAQRGDVEKAREALEVARAVLDEQRRSAREHFTKRRQHAMRSVLGKLALFTALLAELRSTLVTIAFDRLPDGTVYMPTMPAPPSTATASDALADFENVCTFAVALLRYFNDLRQPTVAHDAIVALRDTLQRFRVELDESRRWFSEKFERDDVVLMSISSLCGSAMLAVHVLDNALGCFGAATAFATAVRQQSDSNKASGGVATSLFDSLQHTIGAAVAHRAEVLKLLRMTHTDGAAAVAEQSRKLIDHYRYWAELRFDRNGFEALNETARDAAREFAARAMQTLILHCVALASRYMQLVMVTGATFGVVENWLRVRAQEDKMLSELLKALPKDIGGFRLEMSKAQASAQTIVASVSHIVRRRFCLFWFVFFKKNPAERDFRLH